VSIYGRLVDVPLQEKRKVFDTNFWGVVHGCKAAVRHLKERGGAIINVGSEASVHPLPLQGIYSASKHAVKAYNDALRMELEKEGIPVSVTLIKPSAINTPFTAHAANHMEQDPDLPPPLYAPEVVARAIVSCAERPIASLFVGGSGVVFALLETVFPRLTERLNERTLFDLQKAKQPKHRDEGLMSRPKHEGDLYGDSPRRMRRSSLYTEAALHPVKTGAIAAGMGGLLIGAALRSMRKRAS
jgi:short-subunit dehydrogenase